MSRDRYVILVVPPDTIATVHGNYLKRERAEEVADRLRRGLKRYGFEVRVMPLRPATTAEILHVHGLDEVHTYVIVDPRSPTGFRQEAS